MINTLFIFIYFLLCIKFNQYTLSYVLNCFVHFFNYLLYIYIVFL